MVVVVEVVVVVVVVNSSTSTSWSSGCSRSSWRSSSNIISSIPIIHEDMIYVMQYIHAYTEYWLLLLNVMMLVLRKSQ